ncbi:unnamed protein product [Absidia cylindrospora]
MEGDQQIQCSYEPCVKVAHLRCPQCTKDNIHQGSHFCSNNCLRKSWKHHNAQHLQREYDPFPTFNYSGQVRAVYPLSPRRRGVRYNKPDYVKKGYSVAEANFQNHIVKVYNNVEINIIRNTCAITRDVSVAVQELINIGTTTDDIDAFVHGEIIARDAYPSPLNYFFFPKSCFTSVNEVICHGIPDRRQLQNGDIVNLNISCYHNGFHANRIDTYIVGNGDERSQQLVQCARDYLTQAVANVTPRSSFLQCRNYAPNFAEAYGFGNCRLFFGHGVNQLIHHAKDDTLYNKNTPHGLVRPGQIFTMESLIYEGTTNELLWPDHWTLATEDGTRTARFLRTYLMTENGPQELT